MSSFSINIESTALEAKITIHTQKMDWVVYT